MTYEQLETETFEVIKGDFKTTIICKFNPKGYLVSHTAVVISLDESELIKILKDELHSSINKEDYEEAAKIQEKINKLRDLENQKPTL